MKTLYINKIKPFAYKRCLKWAIAAPCHRATRFERRILSKPTVRYKKSKMKSIIERIHLENRGKELLPMKNWDG